MKKWIAFIVLTVSITFSSCFKDLDTVPSGSELNYIRYSIQ
jgi:hypothetical protein